MRPVAALALALCALLCCARGAATEAPDAAPGAAVEYDDLLLVVGLVTETKARILYEALSEDWVGAVRVEVLRGGEGGSAHWTLEVTTQRFPQILVADGLEENTDYAVHFRRNGRDERVTFRTMISPASAATGNSASTDLSQRMVVVSCDRFVDFPSDDDFVRAMSKREAGRYNIMVHLGDNIYADKYAASHLNASFEEVSGMWTRVG